MPVLRSIVRRVRGDDLVALSADVAGVRDQLVELRLVVTHLADTLDRLNHDVRAGSAEGLPLFLGYAERFRTDAETAVAASVVIDRQMRRMTAQLERMGLRTEPDA